MKINPNYSDLIPSNKVIKGTHGGIDASSRSIAAGVDTDFAKDLFAQIDFDAMETANKMLSEQLEKMQKHYSNFFSPLA